MRSGTARREITGGFAPAFGSACVGCAGAALTWAPFGGWSAVLGGIGLACAAGLLLRALHAACRARAGLQRELAECRRTAQQMRESERRYRSLVSNLPIGVYRDKLGPDGGFQMANPALVETLGYDSQEEFLQTTGADFYLSKADRDAFAAKLLAQEHIVAQELRLKKKDGTVIWAAITAYVVRDDSGRILYSDGAFQDITERKRMEDLLIHRARIDPLTELWNRRALMDRLRQECSRLQRHQGRLSLVLVDVDRFKQINDTHGHPAGDRVLRTVAKALSGQCRQLDLPARYGGDEFAIVVPHETPQGAAHLAERCRKDIEAARLQVRGVPVPLTASLGVAGSAGGASPEGLLRQADQALLRAKAAGRNRVELAVGAESCEVTGGP